MLRLAVVNWRSARCIRAARFCWKRFPNMMRVPTFVCGVPSSWKAPRRLSEQGLEIVTARLDKVEIVWKLKYYHFSDVLRNILAFHLSTSTPLLSHWGTICAESRRVMSLSVPRTLQNDTGRILAYAVLNFISCRC